MVVSYNLLSLIHQFVIPQMIQYAVFVFIIIPRDIVMDKTAFLFIYV